MPFLHNFNKSFDFLLKEEENKVNENEKSFEECILSELPEIKSLDNSWSFQENNDAMLLERQVRTMMESIESIHKALSGEVEVKDIFKMPDNDSKNLETFFDEKNLKTSFEQIQKMDAILKTKITEEKKAKHSRIQTEEESRDILTRLPSAKMSSGFKINLKEFLKLLHEAEKPKNDSSSFHNINEWDGLEQDGIGEEKRDKISNHKFVERNIQLAKCGRGTLSLTDEEKLRIKDLLVDIEEPKEAKSLQMKKSHENEKVFHFYAIDEDVRFTLNQIDEKLEVLNKERKNLEVRQNVMSLLEKAEGEEKVLEEEGEKENANKGKQEARNKSNRLNEIDKLLSSMNGCSSEEINPLTEEEIRNLIQQSLIALRPFESEKNGEIKEKEWSSSKVPEEVIAELVSNAKLLMPKFKYRFDEF